MTLFVDTSAYYAAASVDDLHNSRAKEILATGEPLVTSDHVLVEAWMLINRRIGNRAADRFWAGLRGTAEIEPVAAADLEIAWRIGEDFPDQEFSIVDRTSFAVMQRLGVFRAAAFDDDFAVFRFGPSRRRAFEVVR